MSFPRYPKYKDSGVEWLGEVPTHWELRKLKHIASFVGGGTPSRERPDYWNGNTPWVSPKDMKSERITETEEAITMDGLANSTATLIPPQQVLMVVRSGILKHTIPVAINDVPVALNQDVKAISFLTDFCISSYFLRWVQGLNDSLLNAWAKQGATVESLESEYLTNTVIALPTLSEQSAITAFLDCETTKIDELVAEQERLIELLKEKRGAVISHAVTKGLNPDAPMKPSGVEWLGEVPAHWEVKKLKHVSPELTVGIVVEPSKLYVDEGVPALRSLNVRAGEISLDNMVFITHTGHKIHSKSRLRAGDIVAVRTGQPGAAAVIPLELDGCNCIDLIVIRKPIIGSERFLCWYFGSDSALGQFAVGSGGAIQQHFNISTAAELIIPVPPAADQIRIAAFLDATTAKFDALTAEAQRAIELLQERRTALISAAVTGQIDVRAIAGRAAA
ncbi:restriction endonuclease subunit S [Corallococcus macrosporus]|uniref:Restriction endonuclease subunit S n=1 Tax=Corallococcus macrosporus TaxID=35 RepID=A0ABS3DEK2_9BACT|nr:restriction endonuclease subunit S [Corallococcus macrosporus]MBN8229411.1 restriction endonuclease subunit S [Corallococcus macrosporus]